MFSLLFPLLSSFFSYLKLHDKLEGPSLIVVPLSVLTAWCSEFKKWCPIMKVLQFHSSDSDERERIRQKMLRTPLDVDIVVTTYDMMTSNNMRYALSNQIYWRYVVMDEGHKIKNELSGISQQMQKVRSEGRLILTGTPLQNNLHELWAMLKYLEHDVFDAKNDGSGSEVFDSAFDLTHNICDQEKLDEAGTLLRIFQLRRLKVEVEKLMPTKHEMKLIVKLSDAQKFWAKRLLARDARMLAQIESDLQGTGAGHEKEEEDVDEDGISAEANSAWKRMNSLLMQLRKVCNHPYLLPGADPAPLNEDGSVSGTDESIVTASNKMVMLDRLLERLFKNNHRVVLFSQFTSMLDIFEDFLNLRGYRYVRLDGSSSRTQRTLDLRVFNKEGSEVFIFLMSTRAGGLGINAQTADTVILYDSDWNPQVDQQAMARVHRIGQTKKVHIYRLITGDSVEERIITRAEKKLFMDKMVNRDSQRQGIEFEKLGKKEMLKMLKFGAHAVFGGSNSSSNDGSVVPETLDDINVGISLEDLDQMVDRTKDYKSTVIDASEFEAEAVPLNIRDMLADEMKTSKKQSIKDIAKEYNEEMSKKRVRVSRILTVDGERVLRENNYTMSEGIDTFSGGTKSTSSSSSSSSKKSPKGSPRANEYAKTMKGKNWVHDSWCLICWDGGKMLCCDRCPASFHERCLESHGYLGRTAAGIQKDVFVCPQHMCRSCGRRATAAGGVLIACTECPACFCEEHEPDVGCELDSTGNDRWEALGMKASRTTYFCRCSEGCTKFNATRVAEGPEAAIDQVNKDIVKAEKKRKKLASAKKKTPAKSKTNKKSTGLTPKEKIEQEQQVLSKRPVIPPRADNELSVPGTVVDYDGFRWYICSNGETPGQVSWELDIDCALLVYQNQNISGLGRSSKLIKHTPLMLGRGESPFLSKKEANALLKTDPHSSRPKKKKKLNSAKKVKVKKKPSAAASSAYERQSRLDTLIEEHKIIYGKEVAPMNRSNMVLLQKKMPYGLKYFEVANCNPTHVGEWTGGWETCYCVLENNSTTDRMGRERVATKDVVLCDNNQVYTDVPSRFVRLKFQSL